MSTWDGDPQPFAPPTPVEGTRLFAALLLAGTVALLVLAVNTVPVPGIPSLSEMETATASSPRIIVDCQTTWAGDIPMESCYWTLRLDDGKELSWPGAKRKDVSGQVREYLRANGPVTVRHWNGTLYQIELHGGDVYLDYDDVYDSEWMKQRIGLVLGVVVGAVSLLCIGLELRFLQDPLTEARAGELGAYLAIACLVGGLLVASAGTRRMWTGVVGLALFAVIVTAFDKPVIDRARARAQ